MRACELDGVLGGDPLFEVLKRGGLHLVVTEVIPIGGGADKDWHIPPPPPPKKKKKKKFRVLFGIWVRD